MKTIFIFAAGSTFPGILNQIITHPAIVDVVLGVLVGALFALLMAMLFIGPTPEQKQEQEKQEDKSKTKRKPRKIIEQPATKGWTFTPVNYPQGAMA